MNNRKKVIIVRHAETMWNLEKRIQGNSNTALTEYGILQSEKTGKILAKKNIEEVYSSDLGRAMQTAKIINKYLGLSIKPVNGLRERKYGILEGVSFLELQKKYPDVKEKLYSRNPEYQIPNGESLNEFTDRIYNCINNITEKSSSKTILLVTHGGVLECLFYKIIGLPLNTKRRFSIFNSSINIFSVCSGIWELDSWGITDHLDDDNILSL